jgi:hypothetical protein
LRSVRRFATQREGLTRKSLFLSRRTAQFPPVRPRGAMAPAGPAKAGAAIWYVVLWSTQILAAKAFSVHHGGGIAAVFVACLAAELLKLAACAAALRAGPRVLLARTLADVRVGGPTGEGATLLAVAAAYVVYNVLSYVNLQTVPASVYKALLSARLAFAVGLDAARTGRCAAHRLAGAIACAAAAGVVAPFRAEGSARFLAVCAQAFLSALAGAMTQRVLQARKDVGGAPETANTKGLAPAAHRAAPAGVAADGGADGAPPSPMRLYLIDLAERNASLYTVTSSALAAALATLLLFQSVAAATTHGGAPAAPDAAAAALAADAAPGYSSARAFAAMALSVSLSAAAGLSTSHLLTVAGNVAKAMLAGAEVCAVSVASAALFGEPLGWRIGGGIALTLLGFALHERVLPLPAALLARLPLRLQPFESEAEADAAQAAADAAHAAHHRGGKAWGSAAAAGLPWQRVAGIVAGGTLFTVLFSYTVWSRLWFLPRAARMSSYVEAMDAPLEACASAPALWARHHRGTVPQRYTPRRPAACPAATPFYAISEAPHGGTLLNMSCPGGEARYAANFLDDDVRGAVAGVTRGVVFDPLGGALLLTHKVTHLELTCTMPAARRAAVGHTAREVAMLPGPLVRRLEMAGHAGTKTVTSAERPHVIVLLLDALSRDTAEAVLPDFLALLRTPRVFGANVAAALEFRHLGVVGMSSAANWGAIFCGGNCSGPGSVGGALPLLDAARDAGWAQGIMNDFCPAYPYPWLLNGPGPEVILPDRFACMHPGDRIDCRLHDSVTRSWFAAGIAAVSAPRPLTAPPMFFTIAPHEAHSKRSRNYDRLRRFEPDLIAGLRTLNASGTLSRSLVLIMADHGLHYGLRKEKYAPAAEAHRGPMMWALVGADVAAGLLSAEGGVELAQRNAASRFVVMHDVYRTMAEAMGLVGAPAAPGSAGGELKVTPHAAALNFLRQDVPAGRTCREAGVPQGYCACLQRKRGLAG